MAARHATPFISHSLFIYIALSLLLPMANEGATVYEDPRTFSKDEKRLSREYHLRQGALRGLIVKPGKNYDLQPVEMFLGIPYAAPPVGNLRFMPPVTAPLWQGVRMATRFAPVCPQSLPVIKKGNPPSMGRQHYLNRLKPFLAQESEDCLYLNIYVPYREHKSKKFPVLVFIHGDSFEWSSGNPYDGRVLSSYGNVMVVTVNFRLGVLGFMKPSLTEHVYGNNGLLDQLAALQWIKDNIEDLNGDPNSVTLMGHGTGAACVNFLMLSPISNGLFHRAILMSGSALSDAAMTRDPTQYTLQVAQSLGCSPSSKNMMSCLQNKPLSEIKKVQILARRFETPLGPAVAGSFIPSEPANTMASFPNLLSKYQLLSGVTELESYHDFGVIELDHGILENQRDEFITKFVKIVFEGAEEEALNEILKQYSPSKLDPQRWNVETNRDVVLNLFSDARTLAPMINFANYQSKANRQSYFYVFAHNSVSTDYAPLNKSVHGEEMPYILGIPLGGANTHFHAEYTQQEKLLSEVMMRLWTNFVKNGSPNTQSVNEYFTFDKKQWNQYNVEWPEYNVAHQPYLRIDLPPAINSLYRSNYTNFWIETLPNKMKRYMVDPLFEFTPKATTVKPRPVHRTIIDRNDAGRKTYVPQVYSPSHYSSASTYGKLRPYSPPEPKQDTDSIYREIQAIKTPSRKIPSSFMEKVDRETHTTVKPVINMPVKTSSATVTLVVSLAVLFVVINIGICVGLYYKKRKSLNRTTTYENTHQPRAEIGEVDMIGQKSSKDDKSALQTFKNGCSVIKSISIHKMRSNSKKVKKKEECKTPKSDDSGGFRERFQLRRHLSTSTLDAHTKVRDWIANEVMHRCSPNILRKSNSELNDKSIMGIKPFTRSEELLSENKKATKGTIKVDDSIYPKNLLAKNYSGKNKTSEKTTSTSALDSHSSLVSNKQSTLGKRTNKSSDSLKSKGTESVKSKKVSVAIDATPAARTNSILKQEPVELSKSMDEKESTHSMMQKLKTDEPIKSSDSSLNRKKETKVYTNEVTLSLGKSTPLKINHKHSSSDPVTDVNYELLQEKLKRENEIVDILPPVTFRNEVNVTSREDKCREPLSAEEALLTIKRRNFPKVLPDLPKAQKRLSLQPTSLQSFRGYTGMGSFENPDKKVPPQPPPRTTTLDRRLAYKNTKPLSSFDVSNIKKISESSPTNRNYENIDNLINSSENIKHNNKSLEPVKSSDRSHQMTITQTQGHREYPKVIIASSDMPRTAETSIIIKPSPSQVEISSNVPRVRLPDDFHTHASGSITSFSSFCSDDDIDDVDDDTLLDDLAEDKLIQELVGGIESPTSIDVLDSKGPETIFEKKVEIVPVTINPALVRSKSKDDYVCITDLLLPDMSGTEPTAQIKPNFGLNKLKNRSESINKPPEKAVKVKAKKTKNPTGLLNRATKSTSHTKSKIDSSKLEHSNSGSSNDTETSTGTVINLK
ncbi:uncharacterized protein LOC112044578 [Bicyclus anynana]|uniref:Uncharacterized protein LOC112044578 n=1 Tax=Bicyclus anynana TaxID=110368 RepID=A0A6J1MTI4_BICAN|nr:uncharacterized protein LOC112044578 [Bicyclus anynana]